MDLWLYKDHILRNADLINRIKEVKSTTYEYLILQLYGTFWKCSKLTLTNSKSPSTKGLWNLAWFSWWCLAWKGSAVGGWRRGPPPPAPEIWFSCRCRWFWNLCLSSADSCGDCCGNGTIGLCWGCTELALFCDEDTLALGDTLEWALVRTSAPDSLWDGETWGWPLPWTKEKNCISPIIPYFRLITPWRGTSVDRHSIDFLLHRKIQVCDSPLQECTGICVMKS